MHVDDPKVGLPECGLAEGPLQRRLVLGPRADSHRYHPKSPGLVRVEAAEITITGHCAWTAADSLVEPTNIR